MPERFKICILYTMQGAIQVLCFTFFCFCRQAVYSLIGTGVKSAKAMSDYCLWRGHSLLSEMLVVSLPVCYR